MSVHWYDCWFGHAWSKWQLNQVQVRDPGIVPGVSEPGEWRLVDGQKRECETCGIREIRKV